MNILDNMRRDSKKSLPLCKRSYVQIMAILLLVQAANCFTVVSQNSISFKRQMASKLFLAEKSQARLAIDWVQGEPLQSLLPKEDAFAIMSELLSDDNLVDDSEELLTRAWTKLEGRLQNETRSLSEVIGKENVDRIIQSVQKLNDYDSDVVRAFIGSDAVTKLFAKVLYDGIFQFFQTIDVFGNIVNSLPIIGPIRKQIVTETKRQLDRSLGPLVQSFLGSYTKVAVFQAVDFVLSPANRASFGNANAMVVSSLLERPLNSLLPDGLGDRLLRESYDLIRNLDSKTLESYVELLYDILGDKSVEQVVNIDRLIDASPTLQSSIDSFWNRAIEASAKSSSS